MAAEAGTSKLGGDPGLHSKPLVCGASEVYASGPACEEEEELYTSPFYKSEPQQFVYRVYFLGSL